MVISPSSSSADHHRHDHRHKNHHHHHHLLHQSSRIDVFYAFYDAKRRVVDLQHFCALQVPNSYLK